MIASAAKFSKTNLVKLLVCVSIVFCSLAFRGEADHSRNKNYLDGEFWRKQGLTQIILFWQNHVRDTVNGAFYMYLSREGNPLPP